jgi:hypothetical protein
VPRLQPRWGGRRFFQWQRLWLKASSLVCSCKYTMMHVFNSFYSWTHVYNQLISHKKYLISISKVFYQ